MGLMINSDSKMLDIRLFWNRDKAVCRIWKVVCRKRGVSGLGYLGWELQDSFLWRLVIFDTDFHGVLIDKDLKITARIFSYMLVINALSWRFLKNIGIDICRALIVIASCPLCITP